MSGRDKLGRTHRATGLLGALAIFEATMLCCTQPSDEVRPPGRGEPGVDGTAARLPARDGEGPRLDSAAVDESIAEAAPALDVGCGGGESRDEDERALRATLENRAARGPRRAREPHYGPDDVVHSFRSAIGDTIDCVSGAGPGVRALLGAGVSTEILLAPLHIVTPAATSAARSEGLAYLTGGLDEAGRLRACPAGSAPHARADDERVAAGGAPETLRASRRKRDPRGLPVPPPPQDPDAAGYQQDSGDYAWVLGHSSVTGTLDVQGGRSTMTLAAPAVTPASKGHSIAQVWLTGADHPGEVRQTIEAGWMATPGSAPGPQPPHLFVFTTADAYTHACFNDEDDTGCPAWIPNPRASLVLGQTLPASIPGAAQHELTVVVRHLARCCDAGGGCAGGFYGWGIWAAVDDGPETLLGYYANEGFGAVSPGGLARAADDFVVGAEVFDVTRTFTDPPAVHMGEAPIALDWARFGRSAYHRSFGYFDARGELVSSGSVLSFTNPEYVYDAESPAGGGDWGPWFYFGDLRR